MPQSTDPDVRKYDGGGESANCTECHAFVLPLRDFEISRGVESPAASAELWEFLLWGWWAFVANYISDALTLKGHLARLARLKTEVLPQFPRANALGFSQCFEMAFLSFRVPSGRLSLGDRRT